MTNAPKTVGLVHNGFGGWRLWTKDDADDPTVVPVPYILAAEHERLLTERDAEIARLREALAIAADDLEEWVLCKDSLEKAGFNMDDTAKRAEIARAALATIDAVEGERG